jgi:hypothetical protein
VLAAASVPGSISLVFTMGFDPFQALIAVTGKSFAGHVAIGIGDHLLHAYEPGITLEPREEYLVKRDQRIVAEYAVLPDVSVGLGDAIQKVGQRGFFSGAAQIAIVRALQICGSPLQHLVPTNERTCARFAMTLDRRGAHIPEWREINRRVVVPGDLLAVAETGPSFQRVA